MKKLKQPPFVSGTFFDVITKDSGAADKASIRRVKYPPYQLPDSGT